MHKQGFCKNNTDAFSSSVDGSKAKQRLIELFVIMVTVAFAFERVWQHDAVWEITTGAISLCMLIFSLIVGRLYRYLDVCLLILFVILAWFSSFICFGLTASYFISRSHCFWIVFLTFYMVIIVAPDPSRTMRVFTCTAVSAFSIICAFITVHAARTLLSESPELYLVKGCFLKGRLCGLGNANIMGFMCVALFLMSVFGFLTSPKRIRILYLLTAVLGWFLLGLTGCRTGMLGVCGTVGLTICSSFFLRISSRKPWPVFSRFLVAFVIGIMAGLLLLLSFRLPVYIFRGIMLGCNLVIHNPSLPINLETLTIRGIADDDGTMSGRIPIWVKCIKDCFKSVRRALVGISSLSKDVIEGFKEGHHESTQPHAHNVYLETLRKFGLLGFAPWVGLLIIWIRRGIQMLFKRKDQISDRFLVASIAGLLMMGIAEPVPFSDSTRPYLAIPFFIITGYCMRKARERV